MYYNMSWTGNLTFPDNHEITYMFTPGDVCILVGIVDYQNRMPNWMNRFSNYVSLGNMKWWDKSRYELWSIVLENNNLMSILCQHVSQEDIQRGNY